MYFCCTQLTLNTFKTLNLSFADFTPTLVSSRFLTPPAEFWIFFCRISRLGNSWKFKLKVLEVLEFGAMQTQ